MLRNIVKRFIKIITSIIPIKKIRKITCKKLCEILRVDYDPNALKKAIAKLKYKPIIKNTDETIYEIIHSKKSISRLGDGEFTLIFGHSIPFQDWNEELANRLKQILHSDDDILIGINYDYWNVNNELYKVSLKFMNTYAAKNLQKVTNLLKKNKIYYRSDFTSIYASTPNYNFKKYFEDIQKIWQDKDVIIVCGKDVFSKLQYNYFENAKSINYIYAPAKNAFLEYNNILKRCKKINKNKLIISILGPTATVLSYDLMRLGYQALDLGHIAKDYDYFMKKTKVTKKNIFEYSDVNLKECKKNKKNYDFIVSLGRDCACSMYLRKNNLQIFSYPFDWLTNVGLDVRFELILNNFKDFLNLEDIKPLAKFTEIPNDNNHDYYQNIRNGFYYFHDFKIDLDINKTFPEVKKKYDRRIKRFYEKIKSSKRILLVWFSHQPNISDSEIINYSGKINRKFDKKIDILIFENNQEIDVNEFKEIQINDSITKIIINTSYRICKKDMTVGNRKTCNKVFKRFTLSEGMFYFKKKRLKKMLISFIPNKNLRKKLRMRYLSKY